MQLLVCPLSTIHSGIPTARIFQKIPENVWDRQVADLDVTDPVLFGPRIPFCAAEALW